MHSELTNLLPRDRRRALVRDYLARLGTIVAAALILLIVVAAVLMVPTYRYLVATTHIESARLATLNSTLNSSDSATLSLRIATLTRDAMAIEALATAPDPSGAMRAVLAVTRTGVALSSFLYTPASPQAPATLELAGTAATRDSLRSYQLALQASPFATRVDLPVSAYAQDSNISFTMTITLAP